jgi:group I intron endonuclease
MRTKAFGVVYVITCLVNGKTYTGQSRRSVQGRWDDHINNGKTAISHAIKKHGVENFTFEVVASSFDYTALNDLEVIVGLQYNSLAPAGYSMRLGGQGGPFAQPILEGMVQHARRCWDDPEIAEKMSAPRRGLRRSAETKAKMSVSNKESTNREDVKERNRAEVLARGDDWHEKLSDSQQKRWDAATPEDRLKHSTGVSRALAESENWQIYLANLATPDGKAKLSVINRKAAETRRVNRRKTFCKKSLDWFKRKLQVDPANLPENP